MRWRTPSIHDRKRRGTSRRATVTEMRRRPNKRQGLEMSGDCRRRRRVAEQTTAQIVAFSASSSASALQLSEATETSSFVFFRRLQRRRFGLLDFQRQQHTGQKTPRIQFWYRSLSRQRCHWGHGLCNFLLRSCVSAAVSLRPLNVKERGAQAQLCQARLKRQGREKRNVRRRT